VIRASIARLTTTSGTTGTAALEILAPTVKACHVVSIDLRLAAATASSYGLGRPAAKGTTPTSPVTLLPVTGNDFSAVQTKTALAWGVGPTLPTAFFRRVDFPATVGKAIKWVFAKGLFIPAGASLVLWNLATNGIVSVNVTVDE
jgi:hypothetical protein